MASFWQKKQLNFILRIAILAFTFKLGVADLLMRQIVIGSKSNKAIELFNKPSGNSQPNSTESLSQLEIILNTGDKGKFKSIWRPGLENGKETLSLESGKSYFICHPDASDVLGSYFCNSFPEDFDFDGRFGLALAVKNGSVNDSNGGWSFLDVFGNVNRPGPSGYSVAGVEGATLNTTFFRKSKASANLNWTEQSGTDPEGSEWIMYPTDVVLKGKLMYNMTDCTGGSLCIKSHENVCTTSSVDNASSLDKITIGTWTLADFTSNESKDTCSSASQQCLSNVSKIINTTEVDIWNFVGVPSCSNLANISQVTPSYNSYFMPSDASLLPYSRTEVEDSDSISLFTRNSYSVLQSTTLKYAFPILNSSCNYSGAVGYTGLPSHYIAKFNLSGVPISLIGLSLQGNVSDTTACAIREAQAKLVQLITRRLLEDGDNVIILGNLNDDATMISSRTLQLLKDPNGDGQNEMKDTYEATNGSKPQFTYRNGKTEQTLDYILVSSGLEALVLNETANQIVLHSGPYVPVRLTIQLYNESTPPVNVSPPLPLTPPPSPRLQYFPPPQTPVFPVSPPPSRQNLTPKAASRPPRAFSPPPRPSPPPRYSSPFSVSPSLPPQSSPFRIPSSNTYKYPPPNQPPPSIAMSPSVSPNPPEAQLQTTYTLQPPPYSHIPGELQSNKSLSHSNENSGSRKGSNVLLLIIISASIAVALIILIAVSLVMWKMHKRKQKTSEAATAYAGLKKGPNDSSGACTPKGDSPLSDHSFPALPIFPPIDRSLPTIKSGELLSLDQSRMKSILDL